MFPFLRGFSVFLFLFFRSLQCAVIYVSVFAWLLCVFVSVFSFFTVRCDLCFRVFCRALQRFKSGGQRRRSAPASAIKKATSSGKANSVKW